MAKDKNVLIWNYKLDMVGEITTNLPRFIETDAFQQNTI